MSPKILYTTIGVCGLSCRLCPAYNTEKSWCGGGCKTPTRMAVGCPFITCAVRNKGIEFCWDCSENQTCFKWKKHRDYGKKYDSFKCYQTLERDILFIKKNGVIAFDRMQKVRENLLRIFLREFNEGRSKTFYCIAATIMKIDELKKALVLARKESQGLNMKNKSRVMHSILDKIALKRGYLLKLRN